MVSEARFEGPSDLSAREFEIAQAYAAGDTYQLIAERLFIAPSTVRTHLATIYRKLDVSSKIELHFKLAGDLQPAEPDQDSASIIAELSRNLEESIRRERAVAEVLAIISRTDGDVDRVIAAVLRHALELCDAQFGILFQHRSTFSYEAEFMYGIPQAFRDWLQEQGWFSVGPQTGLGRVARTHEVVNITDVRAESVYATGDPLRQATAELGQARSFTAIPMLSGDRLIGAFTIYRQRVRPFDDKALDIAKVFADQSVIAIENARMISAMRASSQD
eukprot:g17315.t1